MNYKRLLISLCAVLFFLTAITFYVNHVIFPQLVKKIAVERLEENLHRKVEIGSIHLNWVRGFVIDRIKIYENDPAKGVFAQADQVSFGLLVFPGWKHYRITIPFINVHAPSVHLVRIANNIWNFNDMFTSAAQVPAAASPTPAKNPSTPKVEIAWGGLTITDGKFLVDDISNNHPWSEYFDDINLKLSLSYKGISYDFAANIPQKSGLIAATVYYQPITKDTQAHIRLKNIDTASYLSLVDIPDVHLNSGVMKDVDLDIIYTQEKISAKGDALIKNLDISNQDQIFKGDISFHGLDAQYEGGDIHAKGQMALNNVTTKVPGLAATGSVQARVNEFEFTKDGVNFDGFLQAQHLSLDLQDRKVMAQAIILDSIKVRQDRNGVQSIGGISTKGLVVQWPHQTLRGDINLKNVSMHMKDEDDIQLKGDLEAENFSTNLGDKNLSGQRITMENTHVKILNQQKISLDGQLSLDAAHLDFGKNLQVFGSLKTDKLVLNTNQDIINLNTTLNASDAKIVLGPHKTIQGSPQLELTLSIPLKNPDQLTYNGSITLSDGHLSGFGPLQSLSNIELDIDFQNDLATINAINTNIMDTSVHANGTITNFKKPRLHLLAEADDLNLEKIGELFPQLVEQYGLSVKGTSFVKVQFDGPSTDPLSGKILAVASFKNVTASSSKLHQQVKNVTGIIEATPDSLKWRDTTAVYAGKKYTLSGSLENFKFPVITASLTGPDFSLQADMVKHGDLIKINSITGKYLNADFDSKGIIALEPGKEPYLDIHSNASFLLENLIKFLPTAQRNGFEPLNPTGLVDITADIKGRASDWKNYTLNADITCPVLTLSTYKMTDIKIDIAQDDGKIKNLTLDGKLYDGTVHAVGSLDWMAPHMPFDLALNVDSTDMHKLKMDSPLKMQEIDGKFYLTTIAHGTLNDFKKNLHATGSLGIRDGFLAEFNLFKGLLGALNDAMRLGQVMITDVDGNFIIDNGRITTENLRFKGPTIVLLSKGWIDFDQMCDLNVTVDLSSGVVPAIAHDVLNTLNIHIYDKISNPKFTKKLSMPQVINTLIKNLLQ